VTNFGLNTRYQPTIEAPARLYFGRFDASDAVQLVEAYYERGVLLPLRGRSCLTAAIPSLAARFGTYEAFARATLAEVFSREMLNRARQVAVTTLESAVLLNDGHGRFTHRPLPRLAQVAPGFGVVLVDFNGDGRLDLCLAQNFFSPQPETGRMDGGMGLLLAGDGRGGFSPVPPGVSGLQAPGDAKGLGVGDLNGDGWPDLIIGINNEAAMAFINQGSRSRRMVRLQLAGKTGNLTGIGARVQLTRTDGERVTAEVYAGGGYLSQSSPVLTFGLGETSQVRLVRIRWPDGRETVETPGFGNGALRFKQR
jgi:hypothetical protein